MLSVLRNRCCHVLRVLRHLARHKLRVVHNSTQQVFPVLHNRRRHALRMVRYSIGHVFRRALKRIFDVVGLRVTGARNLSKRRETVTKSHVLDCT
jgi:hypothetical protein